MAEIKIFNANCVTYTIGCFAIIACNTNLFTKAAGQDAPTSLSRGGMPDLAAFPFDLNVVFCQNLYYNNFGEEMRCLYATDDYGKTSDFGKSF